MIADRETVLPPETQVSRFEFALPAAAPVPEDQWWVKPITPMIQANGYETGTIREVLNNGYYTDEKKSETKELRYLPLERAIEVVPDHVLSIVFGKCSFKVEYQAVVHRHSLNLLQWRKQSIDIPAGAPRSEDQARRQTAKMFLPALIAHLKGETVEVKLAEVATA